MSASAGQASLRGGVGLWRYLPLVVAVTLLVTLVPLALVALLGPARTPGAVAAHVLLAMAISIALARLAASLWTRHSASTELVFGDLLIWGWARRLWAERRLESAARLLEQPTPANGSDHAERVALLDRLSELLEIRNPYTHGHSRRVARHSERIALELHLSAQEVGTIRAAALVHDVGKIYTPRSILAKPGKLTDVEFGIVKRHPGDGARMVSRLGDPHLTAIVRHHHERLDGTGYPDGLAGADIPLGSRIVAVADTFDAITSARAYRRTRTHRRAIAILEQSAGTQLDPDAVAAFVRYYKGRRWIGPAALLAVAPQRLISGLSGVSQGLTAGAAPLAQAVCSVGGIALVGACVGLSLPDSGAVARHDPPAAERKLESAVSPLDPGSMPAAPHDGDRVRRSGERDGRRRLARPTPRDPSSPRTDSSAGATPNAPAGGQGGSTSGSTGRDAGDSVDVPAPLPDPDTVVEPVKQLELPDVQLPVPLPLPAPLPQVDGLPTLP